MKVDPVLLMQLSKAVLAALRRSGRLPTRLDEEDFNDLESEGVLAAMRALDGYDPARGSVRAYLSKPISRAILKAAWDIANVGLTGDHGALQVWSDQDDISLETELLAPDVAEEIEAFDHVWHSRYRK